MNWKLIFGIPPLFTGLCLFIASLARDYSPADLWVIGLLSVGASGIITYFLRTKFFLHGFLMGLFGALLGIGTLVIESIVRPPIGIENMAVPLAAIAALPVAIVVGCFFGLGGAAWRHVRLASKEQK